MLTVCPGVSYIQSILFLYVMKQCYKNMKQPEVLNGVTHKGDEPYKCLQLLGIRCWGSTVVVSEDGKSGGGDEELGCVSIISIQRKMALPKDKNVLLLH